MHAPLARALQTPLRRTSPMAKGFALVAMAASVWALSAGLSEARAADVYWSVGVHSPGVSVGVGNAPPPAVVAVRPHPRPVYVQPAPVVVYPGHRHVPQVIVVGEPVYVEPEPRYVYVYDRGGAVPIGPRPEWRERHHHGHRGRHHGHDRYGDRYDRYDR